MQKLHMRITTAGNILHHNHSIRSGLQISRPHSTYATKVQ